MGQNRVVIEHVSPQINCGQFPIKRTLGESIRISADIFSDGHDKLYANVLWKHKNHRSWKKEKMHFSGNDSWTAEFTPEKTGIYLYTVIAGIDHLSTWYSDLLKKIEASQPIMNDLKTGARLLKRLSRIKKIEEILQLIETEKGIELLKKPQTGKFLSTLFHNYPEEQFLTRYHKELEMEVSRIKARFSTWYELFPRSTSKRKGSHGTFKDCQKLLPEIASMGFDVLYFPPIHPIGIKHRKGKNNQIKSHKNDPGSPWAIGSKEGGHDAVHPQLGTLEDYRELHKEAKKFGIELALDLAFQCSPDHPYIKEHPEWFLWQPDGTVRYAENPPKKYQDIVPFDFECADWKSLWEELKRIVLFWCKSGVRIFRVDNPHTKPFAFWQWLIAEVKTDYPDTLFLSEAFTRPKVMQHLAKIGFDQSYTYFTWRNTKKELEDYFQELASSEYLRPNFWPNTPDILPQFLQQKKRQAYVARLVLAATASSNYGIYGPCFEYMEHSSLEENSEEYLNSEKYEIKHWEAPKENLKELIALVNSIRKGNTALQFTRNLTIIPNDNPQIISYAKQSPINDNLLMIVVCLDPQHTQSGWLSIPSEQLGLPTDQPYLVQDLLSGDKYMWQGNSAFIELNPFVIPAHIFKVCKKMIKEQQFDYFM